MGYLTSAFIIGISILFFVLNLVQCLDYLDTLRDKLWDSVKSKNLITSTTAKITLYNVFDQKSLNFPLLNESSYLSNMTMPINSNNSINSSYSLFNSDRRDLVIVDVLYKLFRPILFFCFLILIQVDNFNLDIFF